MSTSVLHEAKITPEHFENIINGTKTFEIRKDDRNPPYSPADELKLREWNNCKYTGRWLLCDIRLVLRNEYCKEGYCTMSILLKDSGTEQFPSAKGISTTKNSELDRLQQENEQLKEVLRLAVEDMKTCVVDTGCEVCGNKSCEGFDDCEYEFIWKHADKLKGLIEI